MDQRERQVDLLEALRTATDAALTETWVAQPCIVISYDPTRMTVKAQPTTKVRVRKQDGTQQWVAITQLVDVPVCFPSGGGFAITWPLLPGDEVLVVFADRCIDNWWAKGGVQLPAEVRLHDIGDGLAIPGPRSLPNVPSGVSNTNLQIRTTDGLTMIEITPAGMVNIQAPLGVKVTGVVTANGFVTVPPL